MKTRLLIAVGLAASLAVGGAASLLSSPEPDGLERVAADAGFQGAESVAAPVTAVFSGGLFPGIPDRRLAAAAAGFLCTLLLFIIFTAVSALTGRKHGTRLRG